jgi:hypothetical protein
VPGTFPHPLEGSRADVPARPPDAARNVGHGHVFPRPDGRRLPCGGPGACPTCTPLRAQLDGWLHDRGDPYLALVEPRPWLLDLVRWAEGGGDAGLLARGDLPGRLRAVLEQAVRADLDATADGG